MLATMNFVTLITPTFDMYPNMIHPKTIDIICNWIKLLQNTK